MVYAIETFKLSKEFIPTKSIRTIFPRYSYKEESFLAIDNVNIQVRVGEIFSIVGPNGAGKTTLIKILSGLILPTRGGAKVSGYDILKEEEKIKSSIGLVGSEERSFYGRLTLKQNLDFFSALYNLSGVKAKIKIKELCALLEVSLYLEKRFQECSAGIKQRLLIVRSLLSDPQVLFMDEPTKSLDPLAAKSLRDFIKEKLVKERGKTVFFSTHNLFEAVNLADRIAIMHRGQIMACGTLTELRDKINLPQADIEEIYDKFTEPSYF